MHKRVEPVGPMHAPIAIVGEAPGADEERLGVPFVGFSGDLLTRILLGVGIKRESCYITNVCKVRPPANKLERLKELGLTLEDFYPELYTELNAVRPNVIIALGNTALTALTGRSGISNWRGSILEGLPQIHRMKVVATVHPAFCSRVYSETHLLKFDLQRASREAATSSLTRTARSWHINPTFNEVLDYLDTLTTKTRLVIDLETYMKSGLIRTVGIATSAHESFCIPIIRSITQLAWNRAEEREIWCRLSALLLDPDKEWIAQNAQFETMQLWPYIDGQPRWWMDTLRAHAIAYPEMPHSLAFMTSIYTDMPFYKEDGKISGEQSWDFDQLQVYNCKDALVTYEIAEKLEKELRE